ncbi:hypothetical protein HMPREF1869_01626 [Bacteroidales bacterium KA00251]|nr:hypothetical protein HMPREF1869_01626 [Bacteroidales bacterium KA00251]
MGWELTCSIISCSNFLSSNPYEKSSISFAKVQSLYQKASF